jgi:hypothetical protein
LKIRIFEIHIRYKFGFSKRAGRERFGGKTRTDIGGVRKKVDKKGYSNDFSRNIPYDNGAGTAIIGLLVRWLPLGD